MEFHIPVMQNEVVEFIRPGKGRVIVDATLGGGGYVKKILEIEKDGLIIGIDWDESAIQYAKRILGNGNIKYFCENFIKIKEIIKEAGFKKVWGVIFDFGVSLAQLRTKERGFSYEIEGPLDMRMSKFIKKDALSLIRSASEKEIKEIIWRYGEERYAGKIAKIIGIYKHSLSTTLDLARCIEKAVPRKYLKKSLRRVFQAIRIVVNREIENIKEGVKNAVEILEPGGRICTVTYHSIEDRTVKNLFKEFEKKNLLKIITKKPLRPSEDEIRKNPRARSAKLRVAERL